MAPLATAEPRVSNRPLLLLKVERVMQIMEQVGEVYNDGVLKTLAPIEGQARGCLAMGLVMREEKWGCSLIRNSPTRGLE